MDRELGAAATAYLGLGSNLGCRRRNLAAALELLAATPGGVIRIAAVSPVYETAPWGLAEQPAFLNCAAAIHTTLTPPQLLRRAQAVENALGRQPGGPRYGPRLIDVDILLYGAAVVDEPELQLPHPRLHLRAFALIPLAALAPEYPHPLLGQTIGQLAQAVDGPEGVQPAGELAWRRPAG